MVTLKKKDERKEKNIKQTTKMEEEESLELMLCLEILNRIIGKEKNLKKFSGPEFYFEMVLTSLSILIPHLTTEMLNYLDVCQSYFLLIEKILSYSPQKFIEIPEKHRSSIISSLEFAIGHHDALICQSGFQTLASVSSFHLLSTMQGSPTPFASDIPRLQQKIFQLLLYQHLSPETLDFLSDSLLPLLFSNLNSFQAFMQQFIQSLSSNLFSVQEKEKIKNGFQGLVQKKINPKKEEILSVNNRKSFRANVRYFVSTVRSLVQWK